MKDFGLKKLYYSISEVSRLTDLEQYILRYWETEFDQLKPSKNRAGNRIYTNKDIQLILKIKKLLRDKKYTIEGAKNIITEKLDVEEEAIPELKSKEVKISKPEVIVEKQPEPSKRSIDSDLEEIRDFLLDLYSKL